MEENMTLPGRQLRAFQSNRSPLNSLKMPSTLTFISLYQVWALSVARGLFFVARLLKNARNKFHAHLHLLSGF